MIKTLQNSLLKISLILVLILNPLLFLSSQNSFFQSELQKNNIYFYQLTLAEQTDLDNIINYVNYREQQLTSKKFSFEDRQHLVDVRIIFGVLFLFNSLAIVYLIFNALKKTRYLRKNFQQSAMITLLILIFLGINFVYDFSSRFVDLHKILFTNNYWSLDPATSYLIKFFPLQIFIDFSKLWFLLTFLACFVIILTIRFLNKRRGKHAK